MIQYSEKSVDKTALDSWLIREKGEMSKIVPNVLHDNSKRGVKRNCEVTKFAKQSEKGSDSKLEKCGKSESDLRNEGHENKRKKLNSGENRGSKSIVQKEIELLEKIQLWDQFFVEKRGVVKNEWGQLRNEKGREKLTQTETKPNTKKKAKFLRVNLNLR